MKLDVALDESLMVGPTLYELRVEAERAQLNDAAPDLLAVARLALVMFCDPHSVSVDPAARNLKALAEAAIAKATGAA